MDTALMRIAVVIVDRAEGNGEVGTQWQTTYAVPLDMTLREAVKQMFGEPAKWPHGRVTLTVPEYLPVGFDPDAPIVQP